ncbi:MAG: hypothetical protein R3200_11870 [Xanthomonadales bacterium]|nr:hypothetical protein [Xanthomonadales bacterium]
MSRLIPATFMLFALVSANASDSGEATVKGSAFAINQGISGAWLNPQTPGQGFLIDVEPEGQFIFIAWFTYEALDSKVGAPEHRWLTAQGNYAGDTAEIPISVTSGGAFDSNQATETVESGMLTISFQDCTRGTVSYSLDEGLSNEFEIERLLTTEALCESL